MDAPNPAPKKSPPFDATSHLHQTLPRNPGEVLKISRIPHSNSYRVNWYNPSPTQDRSIKGLAVHYIRQSQFLNCRLDDQGKPFITYPTRQ